MKLSEYQINKTDKDNFYGNTTNLHDYEFCRESEEINLTKSELKLLETLLDNLLQTHSDYNQDLKKDLKQIIDRIKIDEDPVIM
jgi:hypothetical protein